MPVMKTSEVLQHALPYLERTWFVCGALTSAVEDGRISGLDYHRVRRMIARRIKPYKTVIGWVASRVGDEAFTTRIEEKLDYRRRWLRAMITEFKAKGD